MMMLKRGMMLENNIIHDLVTLLWVIYISFEGFIQLLVNWP